LLLVAEATVEVGLRRELSAIADGLETKHAVTLRLRLKELINGPGVHGCSGLRGQCHASDVLLEAHAEALRFSLSVGQSCGVALQCNESTGLHLLHIPAAIHALHGHSASVLGHVGLGCQSLSHVGNAALRDASRGYSLLSNSGVVRLLLHAVTYPLTACDLRQHKKLRRRARRHLHLLHKLLLRETLQLILNVEHVHYWNPL
jgi:hypothetical protein